MTSQSQTLAIVFADVSGSSALYKRLGNLLAKRSVDDAVSLMSRMTEEHGGQVVKTIGDEVMARFDSAEAACEAAVAMQRRAREARLALRIGAAWGPALLEADDVFGETVNDAAFVSHIAQGHQIVATEALVQSLDESWRERCQIFDRVPLKGDTTHHTIYRVDWEPQTHSATTVLSLQAVAGRMERFQLRLSCGEEQRTIVPEQTPYTLGRDAERSDLHIASSLASRDHCHIIFHRGKFVLVDHSTNGTYVSGPDQAEIYLRREEYPLLGKGTIALGQPAAQAEQWQIHYHL